jgi:hypothetical protein
METPNRQECDGVDEDAELAGADGEASSGTGTAVERIRQGTGASSLRR